MTRGAWHVSIAVLLAGLSACGGDADGTGRGAPSTRLSGGVLFFNLHDNDFARFTLPDGDITNFEPPQGENWELALSAFWDESGRAFVVNSSEESAPRLFELKPGEDAVPVGPAFGAPNVQACAQRVGTFAVAEAPCGVRGATIRALDLTEPSRWTEVVRGNLAAPSPDATALAYTPDGSTVRRVAIDGTGDRELFELPADRLRELGLARPHLDGLSWSTQGFAVAVSDADAERAAVGVRDGSGRWHVVDLGVVSDELVAAPSWQPGGHLVAWSNALSGGGSVVRVYDYRTESLRVAAVDPRLMSDPVWAPDGRTLLASVAGFRASSWVFVELDGDWVRQFTMRGFPFDWRP